jgi:hypothetical protein
MARHYITPQQEAAYLRELDTAAEFTRMRLNLEAASLAARTVYTAQLLRLRDEALRASQSLREDDDAPPANVV